jgi:hypothetical protein
MASLLAEASGVVWWYIVRRRFGTEIASSGLNEHQSH